MINVAVIPAFKRRFDKLPAKLQAEALEKIELFKDQGKHRALRVHKLKGPFADCYSFSVNFEYRIVFQYLTKKEVVLLMIGDHDVYDR